MSKAEECKYAVNSDNYWNSAHVIDSFSNAEIKDYIKTFFGNYDPDRHLQVADLGCGAGRYTIWLAQNGYDVYACDASTGMLNKTKEGLDKIGYQDIERKVLKSRLEKLAFDDEKFDIVLTNGVIHNAFTCEEYKQCMKECVRVLKTDGVLYLSVFTSDTVDEKLEKVEEHVYLTPDGLRMVLFDKVEIIQMLSDLNLQTTEECALYDIQVETGVRSLFRAIYQKKESIEEPGECK